MLSHLDASNRPAMVNVGAKVVTDRTAHAIAVLESLAQEIGAGGTLVVNCSGRGDKDIFTVANHLGMEID